MVFADVNWNENEKLYSRLGRYKNRIIDDAAKDRELVGTYFIFIDDFDLR